MTNTIPTVKELTEKFSTTSARIRKLNNMGLTRGQIAKHLGIRYQWVRNVLNTPVKTPKEKIDS